jgi:hypothetical protein
MVGVGVTVDVLVGVTVCVGVGVTVFVGVGVGVTKIICPISQLCVSTILTIKSPLSYGSNTSNVYGKVATVAT